MCNPNLEFQLLNPTTQVALYALCQGTCQSIVSIHWNVYQGMFDATSNVSRWILFPSIDLYENQWFFGKITENCPDVWGMRKEKHLLGRNTTNFTASKDLFLENSSTEFWRFEVVYQFLTENSSSSLNFQINLSPRNGSCSIFPRNGTIVTRFTISCLDWFDEDGIRDYSLSRKY